MKKFFLAILAFIYLGVSSGIAMNIHYCMGKFSSVELMHKSDKCGKCGMKNNSKGGCCKDEFKIVKLGDSHKLITNEISVSIPVAILDNAKSIYNSDLQYSEVAFDYNNNSPPKHSAIPLRILHSVFRI